MRKLIVGIVSLALLLSMVVSLGAFVRAEIGDATGTVGNARPVVSEAFTLEDNAGTTRTDRDDGTFQGIGTDVVVFPQFNDVLLITGAIQDYNGLEAQLAATVYDEFYDTTNVVGIAIYADSDGDNDIDATDIALGAADNLTFAGDLSFTPGDNTGELRIDDTGSLTNETYDYDTGNLDYAVVPVYHEIYVYFEDDDDYDLGVGVQGASGFTGTAEDVNGGVNTAVTVGFYCQQAYKVLGVYDEDASTWVNVWDYDDTITAGTSEYINWAFHDEVVPDGNGDDTDQAARSGKTGTVAGTNDYLLGIQWLLPDSLNTASLSVAFDIDDFETYADDDSVLDTLPVANHMDFYYWIDTAPAVEVDGSNATYTPAIDVDATGFTAANPAAGSATDTSSITIAGGTTNVIFQFEVAFIYYQIDIPSFTADGVYNATYTINVV